MSESLNQPRPKISVEAMTEADLKEAMLGTPGNPSYEEQWGISSAAPGTTGAPPPLSHAELELQAKMAEARALNPNAFLEPATFQAPQTNEELDKYKRLYGESENEKGQLRKNQQELMEAFNGLMAQYEALQTSQPQQQNWGNQGPPTQFGPNSYPPANVNFSQDPFEGIGDDDVLQGKQLKSLVQNAFAPALQASFQQAQAANARAAGLERQLLQQAKVNSGITKLDEFRLAAKNPWLNGLPEAQRFAALQSLKQAEAVLQPPPQPPQVPQSQTDTQNRILNKITYVEGSPQNVPDTSEAAIEAAKQRDFAKVMAANPDTGERARMFRQFAQKYGMHIGSNPSDLVHGGGIIA